MVGKVIKLNFIALEYVPGRTLDQVLEEEGPLEVERALGIAQHRWPSAWPTPTPMAMPTETPTLVPPTDTPTPSIPPGMVYVPSGEFIISRLRFGIENI